MVMKYFNNFLNNKNLKAYHKIADSADQLFTNKTSSMTIEQLREELLLLKNSNKDKKTKTIEALAIAKAASQKVLGMTYYRVQLLGGMALIDGNMAEMKTGEGKTLTCSIATITNFVLGFQTHVITANEYLSKRDEATLKPLYQALGISSDICYSNQSPEDKRHAYNCDIIYSTASELGFDYLRDNIVKDISEKVQPISFKNVKIIIDEADFVLIDEATTPLILSGHKPLKDLDIYHKIREITADFKPVSLDPHENRLVLDSFKPDGDFWLDKKSKRTWLSDQGYDKLEKRLIDFGVLADDNESKDLYHHTNSWLVNEVCQSLNATWLYERDKDYVVMDDEIVIVDPNTGRLSQGRSWSYGLHQAIQAKENITVKPESVTIGSITIQSFLKMYAQISGMSGTIMQSTEEFEQIYNCTTISIPPNKPSQRTDEKDKIYKTIDSKYQAMIKEVLKVHNTGQPILIGTVSVSESELVSNLLVQANVKHQVINAKNHELEAKIIAQAGQKYKVTVATSMAGRGTDIILGGNKEAILTALEEDLSHLNERIEFAKYLIEEKHGEVHVTLNKEDFARKLNLDYTLNNEDISVFYNIPYIEKCAFENYTQLLQDLYQIQFNIFTQMDNIEKNWEAMRSEILDLGGLCVIGSSRNVSRRIDNQLIGRAGRQGDKGRSIFFLSFEDPWIQIFGNIKFLQNNVTVDDNNEVKMFNINNFFDKGQKTAEGQNFEARKSSYQFGNVSDESRREFVKIRNTLLLNKEETLENILIEGLLTELTPITNSAFETFLEKEFNQSISNGLSFALNLDIIQLRQLVTKFKNDDEYAMYNERDNTENHPQLLIKIKDFIQEDKENNLDKKFAFSILKYKAIDYLDNLWADHLSYIDTAQKSVGYSSLVQKNPIYEFNKLCFESFSFLFQSFVDECLENYLYSYQNREAIIAEREAQAAEMQKQFEEINSIQEANRIQQETNELLIKKRRQFLPDELIEQVKPQQLFIIRFKQYNESLSDYSSFNNSLRNTQRERLKANFPEAKQNNFNQNDDEIFDAVIHNNFTTEELNTNNISDFKSNNPAITITPVANDDLSSDEKIVKT